VFLAQSTLEIDELVEATVPDGTKIVPAGCIERDAKAFVESEPAVLTLANRYDGIDLPDRACRMIVMSACPTRHTCRSGSSATGSAPAASWTSGSRRV
jgi:hypothetical protein